MQHDSRTGGNAEKPATGAEQTERPAYRPGKANRRQQMRLYTAAEHTTALLRQRRIEGLRWKHRFTPPGRHFFACRYHPAAQQTGARRRCILP
ncbi:putative prophage protein [Erwinia amylovora ATCC 49946]|nr:putative prophage protein [Erwinia amylovora ATCC 49946]